MMDFKNTDFKKRKCFFIQQKENYRIDCSNWVDGVLLQLVYKWMSLSLTDLKAMPAFKRIFPETSCLKQLSVARKGLNLPLSDPMALCYYWQVRALATKALTWRLWKSYYIQKMVKHTDVYQHL